MEVGADDFLSKPVDRIELLVRVKSMLRIKTYYSELLDSYREIATKNERLQELEKLKDGLVHMIIHDLRNPLAAISGYVEVVLMDKQNLAQNQLQSVENCLECCHDLTEMIQRLLAIHRMEEGKLQLDKKLTDLGVLIGEVIQQFIPKAEVQQISIAFKNSHDSPSIIIDSGLIKRVIANLLNNAIRHTPDGGKVEVVTDPTADNGNLCISVKDTGNGLEPKYHQKVFNKFEQVAIKKAGIPVGTSGLGLAFCKMAVEAHGGQIWVESEGEGKGSIFSFIIPVNPKNIPL